MRIVFLGTGEIGIPSLRAVAARHDVVAVFTQPDRPAGRDLKLRPPAVKVAAQDLGLPVWQPEKIRAPDAVGVLEELRADVIVVVAYGQILPRRILDLPKFGCLNVHASLLPRHRGASPIHAAVLAGDAESGVTIMQMDEGLDTGDMLGVVRTPIGPQETAGSLHDRLGELAPDALLAVLEEVARGELRPEKQDDSQATHAPKLTRAVGCLDWSLEAVELDRRIRGLSPWPGVFTHLPDGVTLKVHSASREDGCSGDPGVVVESGETGILVATGRGGIRLNVVQAAGAKRLAAAEFLRGYRLSPGDRLS